MRWTTLLETQPGDDSSISADGPQIRFNKDPWSWITHLIGTLLAAIGTLYLLIDSHTNAGGLGLDAATAKQTGMAIYGGSLTLCMATSTGYHFFDIGASGNRWLRRLDHCAIFLLIGGTFVPACLHLLHGSWRSGALIVMAVMASAGILFKLIWIDAPRWLGVTIYVAMGWAACIPGTQMFPIMTNSTLAWLFTGAAFYTVGALIYATRRPDPLPDVFGFHEVWHLFVLAGAACHYAFAHSFCALPCPPL